MRLTKPGESGMCTWRVIVSRSAKHLGRTDTDATRHVQRGVSANVGRWRGGGETANIGAIRGYGMITRSVNVTRGTGRLVFGLDVSPRGSSPS